MSKCAPNSPFDPSDNKQIVSRLPPNRSSPLDQWQTRCQTPINFNSNSNNSNDINYRPIVNNLPVNLYQRVFTPRSSYLSPSHNLIITSSPTINPNISNSFHQLYNHSSNNEPNYENVNHLVVREVNRPVYMTPDPNRTDAINSLSRIDVDFDSLKSISELINNMTESNSIERKSESPQSTANTDSTPNRMTDLIEQMKTLTDDEQKNADLRKDVDLKISELDQQLKDYEQKIQLRENLRKLKNQMNSKEESFQNKRRMLLTQMEKCQNSQKLMNNQSNNTPIVSSKTSEVTRTASDKIQVKATLSKDENKKVESTHQRTSQKRAISSTSKSNPVKKVKINNEISSAVMKEVNKTVKTGVKTIDKVNRKTPDVKKPFVNTSQTQSKVNRLCRQQTQTVASSGVKSSRPQKMSSSRLKKPIVPADSRHQTSCSQKSSEKSNNPIKNIDSEPNCESKPLSDTDSDNQVFSELSKFNDNKDSSSSKASDQSAITSNPQTSTVLSTISASEQSEQNMENVANQSTKQQSNLNLNDKENSKESGDPTIDVTNNSNDLKTNKVFELVEIDDDDEEDMGTPQQLVKLEEEKTGDKCVTTNEELERAEVELKKKTSEVANNLIPDQLKVAMKLKSKTSDGIESSYSGNSEDQTNSKENDEVCKVAVMPKIKKHKFKYYGIEPEQFPPTVSYSINSFKAIAGPKSKTSKTTVIFLKSFKDYLFASFTDCTLRRYHIENKNEVLKYEGHEDFVLSLIVFRCPSSSDTFYLYTGSKDCVLRVFNAMTGASLFRIQLSDEISCLHFCWSHVFAGLKDGNLCKIKLFDQNQSQSQDASHVEKFVVNLNKRICAIKAMTTNIPEANCEPVLVVSNTKIRIVNTVSSIEDEKRILYSLNVNFSLPIYVQIYQKHLFIAFKLPQIKSEDKKKRNDISKVLVYDLQKDWKPIREIDVSGIVTSLQLNNRDLIITSFNGKIQCIDCEKLELKWIAYHSLITASVMIGDRLILGNEEGLIDLIYLDGQSLECDKCAVSFARQVDLKHHIKHEHKASHSSSDHQNN